MVDEMVADSSALVMMLIDSTPEAFELGRRLAGATVHAPHLIDAEVGDVLRRKVLHGEIEDEAALTALMTMENVVDERYLHVGPLTRDAWALRKHVRFYDALYVALAARLKLPLVTADAKLGRAHDLPCEVEVVGSAGVSPSRRGAARWS